MAEEASKYPLDVILVAVTLYPNMKELEQALWGGTNPSLITAILREGASKIPKAEMDVIMTSNTTHEALREALEKAVELIDKRRSLYESWCSFWASSPKPG